MADNGFSMDGFSYVENKPRRRRYFAFLEKLPRIKRAAGEEAVIADLAFRAALCAVAVLCLFAVRAGGAPEPLSEYSAYTVAEAEAPLPSETIDPQVEDIGRLRFVEGDMPELTMPVSGSVTALYDGEDNLGLSFATQAGAAVTSVTDGLVCEVTALQLKVGMEDGTVVFYQGVTPTAQIGDYLKAGDILGYSTAGELTVGAIVDGVAVDPISLLQK